VIGALLGTQSNREVSIVNSFELIYGESSDEGDVAMGEGSVPARLKLNAEFLENRKDQCRLAGKSLSLFYQFDRCFRLWTSSGGTL